MANLTHTCGSCGKQLSVPDRYVGRNLKCPYCGMAFRLESPAAPAPPPAGQPPAPFTSASAPPEVNSSPMRPETETSFTAEASVRFTLKRIDVVSAAKVSAAMHGLLGFAFGVVFAISVLILPLRSLPRGLFALGKGATALLALLVAPGSAAIAGLVLGAALAWLYNVTVTLFGAVTVDFE